MTDIPGRGAGWLAGIAATIGLGLALYSLSFPAIQGIQVAVIGLAFIALGVFIRMGANG